MEGSHIRCHQRDLHEPQTYDWVDERMAQEEFEALLKPRSTLTTKLGKTLRLRSRRMRRGECLLRQIPDNRGRGNVMMPCRPHANRQEEVPLWTAQLRAVSKGARIPTQA